MLAATEGPDRHWSSFPRSQMMPDAHFLICGISAPAPGLHRRGAEHWTVPERDAHFLDICWRRRPVLMLAISQHLIAWCWSAAAISDTVTLQLFPIVFFCSLLQLIFSLRKKSGQTSVRLIFEFALMFFLVFLGFESH